MSHKKGKENTLIFGIRKKIDAGWCQYNLCYTCKSTSRSRKFERKLEKDTKFFRWSEEGILVTPTYDFRLNSYGKLKAEFLSIGRKKFVLSCYENAGVVIRTGSGLEIVKIDHLKCFPDEYIQTFHALTLSTLLSWRPKVDSKYQLGDEMNPNFSWDPKPHWVKTMFYYFTAASIDETANMCYWKPVNLPKPNTCPTIIDDRIELNSDYYLDIMAQLNYGDVIMYEKDDGLKLMYFAVDGDGDDKVQVHTIVVTDSDGGHILTLKGVKLSTMEIFSQTYFIHTKFNDKNTKHVVFGSRLDVNDAWCVYSIYRTNENTVRTIDYDYTPQSFVFTWRNVKDANTCPELDENSIHLTYEDPSQKDSFERYLWIANKEETSGLVLDCYKVEGTEDLTSSVIRKLNGDLIIAIIENSCLVSKNDIQLKVVNIKESKYLLIGNWNMGPEKCQYGVCMDCESKNIQRIFQQFPQIPAGTWTKAGFKWSHDHKVSWNDYPHGGFRSQFMTLGKTSFVLVYNNILNLNSLLRTASGTRIGIISTKPFSTVPNISYYFFTKTATESKIYAQRDCGSGCDVRPGPDKDVWVFFTDNEDSSGDFVKTPGDDRNFCEAFGGVSLLLKGEKNINRDTATAVYWNGGTPRFTMRCYDIPKKFAVITQNEEHILTLDNFPCTGVPDNTKIYDNNVANVYINTVTDDTSRIVVGMSTKGNWCYYSLSRDINVEDGDRWIYYNYQPDYSTARWFKEGECSSFPKTNIRLHQEGGEHHYELGERLKTYVSLGPGNYKLLFCYVKEENEKPIFTFIMKPIKGGNYVTINGLDSSTFAGFSLPHLYQDTNTYLALFIDKPLCRYYICLDCESEKVLYNIYEMGVPTASLVWNELSGTSIEEFGETNGVYLKNSVSIEEETIDQKTYDLVVKYVTEDGQKLNLYCYSKTVASHEGPRYISVVKDVSDNFVFKITDHDCEKNIGHYPATVKYDKEEKELFFVMILQNTYAICQKCETKFITRISIDDEKYTFVKVTWIEDSSAELSHITRDDISLEENNFQIDESYVVLRYISYRNFDEQFQLICHSKAHSTTREYIAVMKDKHNKHMLSIKGIDCTSMNEEYNDIAIATSREEEKVLVYIKPAFRGRNKCQIKVCTGSNLCDEEIMFCYKGDSLAADRWLTWSETGIKMDPNRCPSPEIHEPTGSRKRVAKYFDINLNALYYLECFQSDQSDMYDMTLTTMKGYYIQTMTVKKSRSCVWNRNTVKTFYVVKHSKSMTTVYGMNQSNMEKVIESCWEKQDNDEEMEIWFYYFFENFSVPRWERMHLGDEQLPETTFSPLSQEGKGSLTGELVAEYYNGGRINTKISCYKSPDNSGYAIITDINKERIMKASISCLDHTKLEDVYIDTEDLFTIFGIRRDPPAGSTKKRWSYYSLYAKGDKVTVRALRSYNPSYLSAQWYKENPEECPAIKSENIITDDSLKTILDKETPVSLFTMALTFDKLRTISVKNVLSYNCYKKTEGEREMFVLVVTDGYGDHVVSVKELDCSEPPSDSSHLTVIAVPIRQPDSPPFLLLGSRQSAQGKDPWCHYGMCLDCETKQIRQSAGISFKDFFKITHWNRDKAEECPAVQRSNLSVNEGGIDPNGLTAESVRVLSVFSYSRANYYSFTITETFIIYCYYKENDQGQREYTMVVRSEDKRHLVTINGFDCSSSPLHFTVYLFTFKENNEEFIALGTKKTLVEEWCRYNIWLNSPTTRIRRYIHYSTSKLFKWMPKIEIKNSVSVKEATSPDDGAELIAKYQNGKFAVECYLKVDGFEVDVARIILVNGKRVDKSSRQECHDIDDIKEDLKIINSKLTTDDTEEDLLIGYSPLNGAECCKDTCDSCENAPRTLFDMSSESEYSTFNEQVIKTRTEVDLKREWSRVKLDSCYSIPEPNIITNPAKVNMDGYKKITSYINLSSVDEDTFVVFCYEKGDEGPIATRIKSLRGGIDVFILNLDCKSRINLNNISYFAVELKEDGQKYLVLGSRLVISSIFPGPWCRYDICINCNQRLIKVSEKNDPTEVSPLKWSEEGVRIKSPGDPYKFDGEDVANVPFTSIYTHIKHNFKIECRDKGPQYDKTVYSVLKFDELPLLTIYQTQCLGARQIVNFYIYSLKNNHQNSLLRFGQTFNKNEFETLTDINEQWFYFWERASINNIYWIEMAKFKLDQFDQADVQDVSKCLPRDRSYNEFFKSNTP